MRESFPNASFIGTADLGNERKKQSIPLALQHTAFLRASMMLKHVTIAACAKASVDVVFCEIANNIMSNLRNASWSFKKLFGPPNRQITTLCSAQSKLLNVSYRVTASNCSKSKVTFTPDTNVIRNKSSDKSLADIVIPMPVRLAKNPDDINVGEELSGKLAKKDIIKILNEFFQRQPIRSVASENGIDIKLFQQAFISFRKFCIESEVLPTDLHIIFSDILQNRGHVDDLFPFFLKHARQVFPHLECIEELKKISDLRLPPNWYPEARSMTRKFIYHAGPTNSGKTYHALERFIKSKSGVYCGPLKLLAVEVHAKTNVAGTACDLVTGEERRLADPSGNPASHVACTVEMSSLNNPVEIAVIDEIQMVRDQERGWAWTRALLGIPAKEVHLCGEEAAVDLVREILESTGEILEVKRYKRLTPLAVEQEALESLNNIRPGDCVVCFSKKDIYKVSLELERRGHQVAVIYGTLPPTTKLSQTQKFNDPNDSCKILVATDAIGMGLNLSIKRIIFYSLVKPTVNEKGEVLLELLSTSQALQIAGRAGRFGTHFDSGFVTTFKAEDLSVLNEILSRPVEKIEAAGLHPTADQIELFAYHLPHATLSNLIDIFVSLCQVDTQTYFMCNIENFKFLADMIQHVPLPLRTRYVFCCAPINLKMTFVGAMFLKFARQYSNNQPMTLDWLCRVIGWPFTTPKNIMALVHLEAVFDVLDLYLWLSYRFADLFPDTELVRDMQKELDVLILQGVINITKLLRASEVVPKYEEGIMKFGRRPTKAQDITEEEDLVFLKKLTDRSQKKQTHSGKQAAKKASSKKDLKLDNRARITEQLLAKGIITEEMLRQMQQEWSSALSDTDVENDEKD